MPLSFELEEVADDLVNYKVKKKDPKEKATAEKPQTPVEEKRALTPLEKKEQEREQELESRRNAADQNLQALADKQLGAEDPIDPHGSDFPDRILAEAEEPESDESRNNTIRKKMVERWQTIGEKVEKTKGRVPNFSTHARDFVWSIYIREIKPETVEDMIYAYMMASESYEHVKNKISEPEYYNYFFRKVNHLIVHLQDSHKNNLLHHILTANRANFAHVTFCLEAMAGAAKERAKLSGAQDQDMPDWTEATERDDRDRVRNFFANDKNAMGDSIFEIIERITPPAVIQKCKDIIQSMYNFEDDVTQDGRPELGELPPIAAAKEAAGKPFSTDFLAELMGKEEQDAAAAYVRMSSEHIDPEDLDKAYENSSTDLFALDVTTQPKEAQKAGNKVAGMAGTLANHYAKRGIFDLRYARKKLIKEDGRKSQGRRDERGYNNYMQMAATPDINHAYMANEHEFWDHILYQIAKLNYQNNKSGATFRDVEIRSNREILDMPGNDGRTAMHLASISGNTEAMSFILDKILDFNHAEQLRDATARNLNPKAIEPLQKRYLQEMRTNLSYLMSVDNDNFTPWMLALYYDKREILMLLSGKLEKHPEYLEVICMLPVQPKGEPKKTTLYEFASRSFNASQGINEAGRFLRSVLREAEQRARSRRESRRVQSKSAVL